MRRATHADNRPNRSGIVLLITLVILVILATVAYTLTDRVAARRHRNNYLVDYAQAQYACDSAMKYAISSLDILDAKLISRPNEPDFSDVFAMSDAAYDAMLARFVQDRTTGAKGTSTSAGGRITAGSGDANGADETLAEADVAASPFVPGPYGPDWPLVVPSLQIEIGSAKVKIEVEDENAKYPLGWGMIVDEELKGQANVSYATFFEWMKYNEEEIRDMKESLAKLNTIRPFKMTFSPVSVAMPVTTALRDRPGTFPQPAAPAAPTGTTPAGRGTASRSTSAPASRGTAPAGAAGARCRDCAGIGHRRGDASAAATDGHARRAGGSAECGHGPAVPWRDDRYRCVEPIHGGQQRSAPRRL